MDIKGIALKFWKPLAAVGLALLSVFIWRSAKSAADKVSPVADDKGAVEAGLATLKPETQAAVADISDTNALASESQSPKYQAGDKDLQGIVDDYQKE